MRIALLVASVVAAGCGGALPGTCEDGSCGTQLSARTTFQLAVNMRLDLLFVIDDTSAMAPHAEALAAGLAAMARQIPGMRPEISLHLGFIRAGGCDASARGAACGITASEQFLRWEWCGNFATHNAPDFNEAFTCLADLGTANCGPAQPLDAALRALTGPPRPGWEGFLRPDAYLMVVVAAATDDASGSTPLAAAAALHALKPDPYQTLVSVIGPGDCAPGEVPGPRLTEFVNQFGANGLIVGLCSGQLPVALDRVLIRPNIDIQPPCFRNVRDTDLATPGLQPSCTAESAQLTSDGSVTRSPLPSCDDSAPPCWRLLPSGGGTCEGSLATVETGTDWCTITASNFTVECLVCADADDPACATAR